jgi:hypothetical protein
MRADDNSFHQCKRGAFNANGTDASVISGSSEIEPFATTFPPSNSFRKASHEEMKNLVKRSTSDF